MALMSARVAIYARVFPTTTSRCFDATRELRQFRGSHSSGTVSQGRIHRRGLAGRKTLGRPELTRCDGGRAQEALLTWFACGASTCLLVRLAPCSGSLETFKALGLTDPFPPTLIKGHSRSRSEAGFKLSWGRSQSWKLAADRGTCPGWTPDCTCQKGKLGGRVNLYAVKIAALRAQ